MRKGTLCPFCIPIHKKKKKSHFSPSQTVTYLGMVIQSPILRAFPSPERISALLLQIEKFSSCRRQSVNLWRSLLGCLSPLCLLVPGGCLRVRSLQLGLRDSWDFQDETVSVPWTPPFLDCFWWWSDTSDQGWGATLVDKFVSVLWSASERLLSINLRELLAICLCLFHFRFCVRGQTVGVYSNNTSVLSYLRHQGVSFS